MVGTAQQGRAKESAMPLPGLTIERLTKPIPQGDATALDLGKLCVMALEQREIACRKFWQARGDLCVLVAAVGLTLGHENRLRDDGHNGRWGA